MSTTIQVFTTGSATGRQGEIVSPATGGQSPVRIDLNRFREGGGVGLLVNISEGSSADYDIEVTGDPMSTPVSLQSWNKHDVCKSRKVSCNGNLAYPVTAVRLYFRSMQGLVTFAVVQPE